MQFAEREVHELRSYFVFCKSDWKYRKDAQEHINGEPYEYVDYMIYQLCQDLCDIKKYFDLVERYNKNPDHFSEPPAPPVRYQEKFPDSPDYPNYYIPGILGTRH